jgi:hypothetical protein
MLSFTFSVSVMIYMFRNLKELSNYYFFVSLNTHLCYLHK